MPPFRMGSARKEKFGPEEQIEDPLNPREEKTFSDNTSFVTVPI